ncbi:AraC family transcriptional regulator [Sphingomonas sp. So64.6b]|uniref:AraC family transcriptional regulator n=1 Tax=Sphingomonas sp. So64.6b TaxID=2997354 RepID=UPI0016037152|nr:AraC family transcriptional regulator [Sphingomonas sp. So64.6b]QNA82873.1 AraC family transcriptional regulator [Sphingomonas sp. So64.6b]
MAEPTVSTGYTVNLLEFSVSRGADRQQLYDLSGIDPGLLSDPDNRMPLACYVALMRAAKRLCDEPALALELGAEKDFKEISVVGLICYAAPTMGEAFTELSRYARLVAEVDLPGLGGRFELAWIGGELWMVDRRTDPNSFPEMTESTWSRFICETARHFPGAPFAKAVHFTHSAPDYRADYDRVLKAPITFDSDRNAIMIDPSWLSIELHQPNRYVFGVLSEHADKLLRDLENTQTMRGRVESILIPKLHRGDVSMDDVAGQLGLSRQSLYRRLKAENVSYEGSVDDLRHRMALHYLGGKKASVNETAYLVGFSDPSSFSRAFKRWTGSSPREWKAG